MIDLSIKHMFFDRPKVQRAVDKAKKKVLSKAGAFVRTSARTSIRKRKGISRPGDPPHSHTGLVRRFVLFGYDRATDSVVVGPVKIKSGRAVESLEYGGRSTANSRRRGRRIQRAVTVKARPFMRPALRKEMAKFPELWRNSIVG